MGGYSGRSACMTTGCWLSVFAEVLPFASALVFGVVGFGSFRAFTSETDWITSRYFANGTGCPHPNVLPSVRVAVPGLRVPRSSTVQQRIGRHEAPHRTCVEQWTTVE